MYYGSLFAGIGGIDLGLERAGMKCLWQVENDPYAVRVLEKHWPGVKRYGDIKAIDWSGVERPDLVCGGFPCQPVSLAGEGLGEEDERWLWPEFVRCLRELQPRYILVENVPGLLGRGMGRVLGELAALGYDAEWESLPAAAFGAPHLRYRVFIVAYTASVGRTRSTQRVWFMPPTTGCDRRTWNDRRMDQPGIERMAHGVPYRVDRLRCLGNAVVPQVAEWVGRRIIDDN